MTKTETSSLNDNLCLLFFPDFIIFPNESDLFLCFFFLNLDPSFKMLLYDNSLCSYSNPFLLSNVNFISYDKSIDVLFD